jgi:isoleucyl-tRNA synthetase
VSKALEEARAAKTIGSSLEAKVSIEAPEKIAMLLKIMEDPEGFFIVSQLEIRENVGTKDTLDEKSALEDVKVVVGHADGAKCPRCWVWSTEIGTNVQHPDVCPRCARVLMESGIASCPE